MTFDVKLEAAAALEIENAFTWYEAQASGLGTEFLRAVGTARDELSRAPTRFPQTVPPFRWVKMRRFPYGIHFRIRGTTVMIVSCLHFRQSAKRWPGA